MSRTASRSNHKGIFWIVLSFIALISGLFIGISNFINRNLVRGIRNPDIPDPAQFGLNYSQVVFPSLDGLLLKGWWFTISREHPTIILLHGIRANRAEPPERVFGIARELIYHGYSVLAFDLRAHGESEGNRISAGYYEKNDLLGAVRYLRQQGVSGKIGVLGFSMGAAISLLAAAECKEISAVVADSAYVDVVSLMKWRLSKWKYLTALLIPAIVSVTRFLYHFDFRKINPLDAIKMIKVPIFIIHGAQDNVVPVTHAYRLRGACKNRLNRFWVVPEASHTDAFKTRTEEYLTRVLSFFREAFAAT
jgi:dipeptidyl aminopeptidase/acylaminoacyl peptidase